MENALLEKAIKKQEMIRNIDTDILRTFITIYESGSFSHAAERLGRTQSTISQQIKKLEDLLEKTVFLRNNRSVSLTTEGEILLPYARKMISMNDEMLGRIARPNIKGNIRLGAPEAFTANHLTDVILKFSQSHPSVALEVYCDASSNLLEGLSKDAFDIILVKRDTKSKIYGNKVWKEQLVWVGQTKKIYKHEDTVPLILSPSPCAYRQKMIDALDNKNMMWSTTFTSSSMTTRIAAAKAGLGITVIPKELLSCVHGLQSLHEGCGLPPISSIEIDLIQKKEGLSDAASRLADHIILALENNPSLVKSIQ